MKTFLDRLRYWFDDSEVNFFVHVIAAVGLFIVPSVTIMVFPIAIALPSTAYAGPKTVSMENPPVTSSDSVSASDEYAALLPKVKLVYIVEGDAFDADALVPACAGKDKKLVLPEDPSTETAILTCGTDVVVGVNFSAY